MMSATVALFVLRISISFYKIAEFLAISFSMIEINVGSVSMTSTNSPSDLLLSFASLVFTVFVDTFGDMLDDLLCASASVEPVRPYLELMDAVQHCRDVVAFHVPN